MAAATTEPQKTQAQLIAESTWASYSQLLSKGDAGILKLYVCDLRPKPRTAVYCALQRLFDCQYDCADCKCTGSQ